MHERTLTFKVSVNDVVVMEIGYTQTHLLGIVADHRFFKWPKFTENNIQATTCKREWVGDTFKIVLNRAIQQDPIYVQF